MKLRESLAAKIVAFIFLLIGITATLASALGSAFMLSDPETASNPDEIYSQLLFNEVYSAGRSIYDQYQNGGIESLPSQESTGNLHYAIYNDAGVLLNSPSTIVSQSTLRYDLIFSDSTSFYSSSASFLRDDTALEPLKPGETRIILAIDTSFPVADSFSLSHYFISLPAKMLQSMRYGVLALFIACALASLGLFIFLLCAVGHKRGVEGIHLNPVTRVLPFDLTLALFALVGALSVALGFASADATSLLGDAQLFISLLGCTLAIHLVASLVVLLFLDLALRLKHGNLWRNTLIYRLLRLITRALTKALRALGHGFSYLPLLPKTCLLSVGLALLFAFPLFPYEGVVRFLLWLFSSALLLAIILALGIMLHKLHKGSIALAEGKFDYRVDDTHLLFDFKEIGQNLNKGAQGLSLAVEDRLKSERMKTELITNVSHDIKTPLTSIINYADLIAKEENKSETIGEYSAVLLRQAERLKKLLEDLVEASKASSGNMEVQLTPIELGVLLTQAAAEYEKRLEEKNLLLVVKQPEAPLRVMADGRLLWRVFDNLMGNITKYAQSGTRVYLSLEQHDKAAVISFKNTSSYPLDLPAEDLLERFTRGDASRNTEGNGLGLSIAQNLVLLQGGTLSLTVDGDLFKVILRFAQTQDGQTPTQEQALPFLTDLNAQLAQIEQSVASVENCADQIIKSAHKSIDGAGKRFIGFWKTDLNEK